MHDLGSRQVYSGVATLALIGGLLGGGLGGLLGLGQTSTGSGGGSQASTAQGGWITASDKKLRKGCQHYAYRYSLTVPTGDDWGLETFLVDPRGETVASDVILSGADAASGLKRFPLCRSNTVPGTFTLRGKLSTTDGYSTADVTWLPDHAFTLTVKHKKHHPKHHHKKKHR